MVIPYSLRVGFVLLLVIYAIGTLIAHALGAAWDDAIFIGLFPLFVAVPVIGAAAALANQR